MAVEYDLHHRRRNRTDRDSSMGGGAGNAAPTVSLVTVITEIDDNADTSAATLVANIVVADDAQGTNALSLSGTDAAEFVISGTQLFLKAGATLPIGPDTLTVTVEVDDASVGSTPDDTAVYNLTVNASSTEPAWVFRWHADDAVAASGPPGNLASLANSAISGDAEYDLTTPYTAPYVDTTDPALGYTLTILHDAVNEGIRTAVLSAGAAAVFENDTAGAFFCVFRLSSVAAGERMILSFAPASGTTPYLAVGTYGARAYMRLYSAGAADNVQFYGNADVLSANTWHCLCFRQDGTSLKIYLDGTEIAYTVISDGDATWWFANLGDFIWKFVMGGKYTPGNGWEGDWQGDIEFAAYTSTAPSEAECQSLTNAATSPFFSGN